MNGNFPTPRSSFILGRFISESLCDSLDNKFKNKTLEKGVFYESSNLSNIDETVKQSSDYCWKKNDLNEELQKQYTNELNKIVELYREKYPFVDKTRLSVEGINYQLYPRGGGYKELHCENLFNTSNSITNSRVLVFMTYLNNIADGGTFFPEQDLYVPSIKGLTLIWPAWFTHPHRSVVTHNSKKSIITGWMGFIV
jgi:hypothetical protein